MAQLLEIKQQKRLVATNYKDIIKIKSKVQRKAADIGFVKKALALKVIPIFAKVKGNFQSKSDEWKAAQLILESNLEQNYEDLEKLGS